MSVDGALTPIGDENVAHGKRIGRTISDAERDAEAARYRSQGLSFRQIGARMGCSHSHAATMVERALRAVVVDSVLELRSVEDARILGLMEVQAKTIANPGPLVSAGRRIEGEHDRDVQTRATTELRKLSESRRKLYGVDAPVVTVKAVMDADKLQADIRAAEAALRQQAREEVLEELAQGQIVSGHVEPAPAAGPLHVGERPAPEGGWIEAGPDHDLWKSCSEPRCDCHRFA